MAIDPLPATQALLAAHWRSDAKHYVHPLGLAAICRTLTDYVLPEEDVDLASQQQTIDRIAAKQRHLNRLALLSIVEELEQFAKTGEVNRPAPYSSYIAPAGNTNG